MEESGLRYNIVTGSFTLPATIAFAAFMWYAGSKTAADAALWWGGFACVLLAAFALMAFDNSFALMRERTRMVPSVFIAISGALTFTHGLTVDFIPSVCLLLAYAVLFLSYQKGQVQGYMFHVFLFVGIGAQVFPQMLYYVPFLWLSMIVQMRCFTVRAFFASLLGVLMPLVACESYRLIYGMPTETIAFAKNLADVPLPDYSLLSEHQVVSGGFVVFALAVAVIHFSRTKFNDKIRTRMFFYSLMIGELATLVFLVAMPQHFDVLFRILLLNGCVILGHHLAFARGVLADIWFYVMMLFIAFIAFYNFNGYEFGIWLN